MPTRHPVYVVDAFSRRAFGGNPAAVCFPRGPVDDATLQAIAAEMNLSETAFAAPLGGDLYLAEEFDLRWFSPTTEVRLCGHATLATAKVLYDELGVPARPITFRTMSGPIRAEPPGERGIVLDFAAHVPAPVAAPRGLAEILGGGPAAATLRVEELKTLLVRYDTEEAVRGVAPDPSRLRRELPGTEVVVVTSRAQPPYDIVSRVFAPALGIAEDPVTGMAHTILGPYFAAELGRTRLEAFQASARGGELLVEVAPGGRVRLHGEARLVLRAYLDLPTGPTATGG